MSEPRRGCHQPIRLSVQAEARPWRILPSPETCPTEVLNIHIEPTYWIEFPGKPTWQVILANLCPSHGWITIDTSKGLVQETAERCRSGSSARTALGVRRGKATGRQGDFAMK